MPTSIAAPSLIHINPKEASPVSAAISATCLFNTDSKTATQYSKSPWHILGSVGTGASNVLLVSVPTGATALDLFHEFTAFLPGTLPKVRVFGEVPFVKHKGHPNILNGTNTYRFPLLSFPTYNDWIPLPDTSNNYAITIGDITETEPMHNDTDDAVSVGAAAGGASRSTTATLYLRGCQRVMVLIDTAATTITLGQIAGNFCY